MVMMDVQKTHVLINPSLCSLTEPEKTVFNIHVNVEKTKINS